MDILIKKHWLSGIDSPDDIDPSKYVGRTFKVLDDEKREHKVVAEEILGSIMYPWKFQINAMGKSYFISALDLFGQVAGYFFSPADIEEFEKDFRTAMVAKNRAPSIWDRAKLQRKIWTPR